MMNRFKNFNSYTNESINNDNDIIITIPKSTKWSDYEKELIAANNGEILNFKVANLPKTSVGCKCYVCHNGQIKGYMKISGIKQKDFTCTTTGKKWSGKFIERTGKFTKIEPIPMKGFQGFRYFKK